jgi:hypothetical protein
MKAVEMRCHMTRGIGGAVLALALLGGCGGSTAPADDVPALSAALERVDDAIVEGRYDDARKAVDELVATTTDAREGGDLETSEADRILVAAAELKSAMPAQGADDPAPTESADPSATPEDAPDEGSDESSDEGSDPEETGPTDDKEQEKLEKEQEKESKKAEGKSHAEGKGSSKGSDKGKGH